MPWKAKFFLIDEHNRQKQALLEELPKVLKPVKFKVKHSLPVLSDYKASVFPEEYWSKWSFCFWTPKGGGAPKV